MRLYWLARRSIWRTLRRPHVFLPAFVMAVVGLSVNTGSLGASDQLPGFPAANFVSFSLATGVLMGALFAPLLAGGDMAQDIQSGYLRRLTLLPLRRGTILLANLAGTAVVGLLLGAALLLTGRQMGATFVAGLPGIPVFLLLVMLTTTALGGVGATVALKTGSTQAVAGLFGFSFALVFFSTGIIPEAYITTDWFLAIARWNPISYWIAGIRSLITVGWDGPALLTAAAIALGLLLLSLLSGQQILKGRLNQ